MKISRKAQKQSIQSTTTLSQSPEEEQRGRIIKYTIATVIRLACIASIFLFPRGWWMLVPAIGAIFLPYFAVVVANAQQTRVADVQRPGAILPVSQSQPYEPFDRAAWEAANPGPHASQPYEPSAGAQSHTSQSYEPSNGSHTYIPHPQEDQPRDRTE